MPAWDEILNTEIDAESPITESLVSRLRDNPRAVAQGDASVPSAEKILVPDALRTTETDISRRLAPDGAGGLRFVGDFGGGRGYAGSGLNGAITALTPGGVFHAESVTITAAQAPGAPVIVYCEGNFDLQSSGSITSSYPLIIRAAGNVTIAGAITAPFIDIRCGGDLTISAAVSAFTAGTWIPKLISPLDPLNEEWDERAIRLLCNDDLTISSTITADDVWIVALGDATISGTVRAEWFYSGGYYQKPDGWSFWECGRRNGAISYLTSGGGDFGDQPGGGGGTCGGGGGTFGLGSAGTSSIWAAAGTTVRPWLRASEYLCRGGGGAAENFSGNNANTNGNAGGRISLYVGGVLVATGGTFNASARTPPGDAANDDGGGGGGVVRVIAKTSITGGTYQANGSSAEDGSAGGGGGGSVYLASALIQGSPTVSASGGTSGGGAGRTVQDTITTDEITALYNQGIFDLPPHRISA